MLRSCLKHISFKAAFLLLAPWIVACNRLKSNDFFMSIGQFLSLMPGKFGCHLRLVFYQHTLAAGPKYGYIGFGSYFAHRESEVGSNIHIGAYSIIGMCRIEDGVAIGSTVNIIAGKHQHSYADPDASVLDQPGEFVKITIGANSWIGNGSVVMADLGRKTIVSAGSVIGRSTPGGVVVAGNPARVVKMLRSSADASAVSSLEQPVRERLLAP